jgi:hypothetical protein
MFRHPRKAQQHPRQEKESMARTRHYTDKKSSPRKSYNEKISRDDEIS